MSLVYADTSALVRAYSTDEPDHEPLRKLLLEGDDPVITSELTRVEMASAAAAASRAGRLSGADLIMDRFDADCTDEGPLTPLRFDPETAFTLAYDLVNRNRLRTLDAIHLAVALTDGKALAAGEPLLLVTRDRQQAAAAEELGLELG